MITKRRSRLILTVLSSIFTLTLFIFISSIYIDHFSLLPRSVNISSKEQIDELESEKRLHKVKVGESLADISKKYYGSPKYIETICEENKIMTDAQIEPGYNLIIPPFP